jgi:nicotinamidase-related amidase
MAFTPPHPQRTAVLFIECQNGILGASSALPALAQDARPVIEKMARLAGGARAAGAIVVHLTYAPVAGNRSSNHRTPLIRRIHPLLAQWHPGHPAVEPIPEIGVGANDIVLQRHTGISPTYGTETFRLLRNLGIDAVVIAGVSANIAVPLVAAQAADEDFDVFVVRDAIAGTPPEHAESMLRNTLAFLATLCGTDELLAAWSAAG